MANEKQPWWKTALYAAAVAVACFLGFLMVVYGTIIRVAGVTIHAGAKAVFEAFVPPKPNHHPEPVEE